MVDKTSEQFDRVIDTCRDIYQKKLKDYGAAWRILRPESLTDQIFIKANRIRSLEVKKVSKVNEGVQSEYIGIINYCAIALIQLEMGFSATDDLSPETALAKYDQYIAASKALMQDKNHDYSEAWRQMRISSLTDLILMKLLRVKQLEDLDGEALISEGIDANYFDMINYAVFAMIRLSEQSE